MDNTMDKYVGRLLDNRYEILEVIGTGGMSVVYRALCHRLNRNVAVKILREDLALDEEFRRRFQTEAHAVAMLSHPNIVAVYDVSHSTDLEYIVMELIDGITLKQYLKKKGVLGWKEALHFTSQTAKALSHAHGRNIVHRDIKPHNIMILKDGTTKVADFGIARLENAQNTDVNETLGSVHYISPEQARGEIVDARSDIYSLGIVMYEMLTGQLPFDGESDDEIAMQHLSTVPVPLSELNPDIPPEVENIVMTAMEVNKEARYQSAEELLASIEDYRKAQALLTGSSVEYPAAYPLNIPEDVEPIGRSGELSKEAYTRRRARSKKVSMLTGFLCVITFLFTVVTFLWNYWLEGLFSEAERLNVPNFVGSYYTSVTENSNLTETFNFTVVFASDPNIAEGMIISQAPDAGNSVMLVQEGIDVRLTVSSGIKMLTIPNLLNTEYREASITLRDLGFDVEIEYENSSSITVDYIIRTNPSAGETLSSGSTVYITVSEGPETLYVTMPNLIGLTQEAAISRLENLGLTVGTVTPVESDYTPGTIIWQSETAYAQIEEKTIIYMQVSKQAPEEESPPPIDNEVSPSPQNPEDQD